MKKIGFSTTDKYVSLPVPSYLKIPSWYKKSSKFTDGRSKPFIQRDNPTLQFSNKGVKNCVPFLDSLTAGYMAELWQDIQVVRTKQGPEISWPVDPAPVSGRSQAGLDTFPSPKGTSPTQFVWLSPFMIQTPPGYSVLITHPFNRFDLPFTTLSAIVDSDSIMGSGHIPFYLDEDFEGIIETGTPIFQIIPFKRESWKSEEDSSLNDKSDKNRWLALRRSSGFYRDNYWRRKSYE